jgi:hypothetical protein
MNDIRLQCLDWPRTWDKRLSILELALLKDNRIGFSRFSSVTLVRIFLFIVFHRRGLVRWNGSRGVEGRYGPRAGGCPYVLSCMSSQIQIFLVSRTNKGPYWTLRKGAVESVERNVFTDFVGSLVAICDWGFPRARVINGELLGVESVTSGGGVTMTSPRVLGSCPHLRSYRARLFSIDRSERLPHCAIPSHMTTREGFR